MSDKECFRLCCIGKNSETNYIRVPSIQKLLLRDFREGHNSYGTEEVRQLKEFYGIFGWDVDGDSIPVYHSDIQER